jgi:hypothetical protein
MAVLSADARDAEPIRLSSHFATATPYATPPLDRIDGIGGVFSSTARWAKYRLINSSNLVIYVITQGPETIRRTYAGAAR